MKVSRNSDGVVFTNLNGQKKSLNPESNFLSKVMLARESDDQKRQTNHILEFWGNAEPASGIEPGCTFHNAESQHRHQSKWSRKGDFRVLHPTV